MVKVCHMTSVHGVEDVRIFHKECVSLAKAGYDVYLVERGGTYDKKGVHIIGVGDIPSNRIKRMTQSAKMVYQKALEIDADIYHFHDAELLPYGLKLKRKGKKVVFDSHEDYEKQIKIKDYLPHPIAMIIAKLYVCYEEYVLKRIDGVSFPSLGERGNKRMEKCRHTARTDNTPILSELYEKYDEMRCKEKCVCYVGGLTKNRGITNIVRASEKIDCIIYLGGAFNPESYQTELQKEKGYKNVRYLGQLNRTQVAELLQKCLIGLSVLQNVGEYLGMDNLNTKVYEYMSMSMPIVLNRTPFTDSMVQKYRFGICVDPENVDEIANAIQYLLDHPNEARQMGENGRRAVQEEFNWGVEEKKLLQLYEDILNDK